MTDRLLRALQKLNPNLPPETFDLAIEELTRDRSAMSLAQANREVYDLIKQGVRVKIADSKAGGDRVEIVRLIDWNRPKQNNFLLVSQFWVTGEMYTRRADLVGFVNGIPLVFIELKATHRRIENAYKDNLRDYRDTIAHLFWYNLFVILSNGSQSKIGSVTAEWEHFSDWKKINKEGEVGVISLETMLVGTCEPARLLDVAENFVLFMKVRGGLAKLVAKNHQYLGVNNAVDALQQTLAYMEGTDMAVVVSQAQNEIEEMREKGLDIAPHRQRWVAEDLDEKFKDPEDAFRLVFVCAMWMTGFDVPSCSTIYLDKPMRNHTLMQTILRANRVFPEKENGLIVDYVSVFRNLEKALAIYGSGVGGGLEEGELPVKDKSELVAQLKAAITDAEAFCDLHGIDLQAIGLAVGFERVSLLDDAVEALLASDETKRRYLTLAGQVAALYRAILPDPAANELAPRCLLLDVLMRKILSLMPEADISQVMAEVEALLDESIATEGYVIQDDREDWGKRQPVDLSEVDFEALRRRFEKGRKRMEAERLKGLVARKVEELVKLNRTRLDFYEKFKQLIEAYNAGTMNTEEFFQRLVDFAKSLDAEESRAMAERLTEEELAIFDLLTKPEMALKRAEVKKIKKVAHDLLQTLKKGKLVLDWRKRQQARAAVRVSIEDVLDKGLPRAFTPELYRQKCDLVYEHVYEAYFGGGRSIYSLAA